MMTNPNLLVGGAALAVCNLADRARGEEQAAGDGRSTTPGAVNFGAETGTPVYVLAGLDP